MGGGDWDWKNQLVWEEGGAVGDVARYVASRE